MRHLRPHTVRLVVFTIACLGFFTSATASGDCEPIGGVKPLLVPGALLLLGELHGTAESPAFTYDVACHAAGAGLDVVVSLELSPSVQPLFDRFLDSPGEAADREALLAHTIWQRDYQDGRTSRAMVDLTDGLRLLRRQGRTVRVGLFDASGAGGGQARERAMAGNLAAIFRAFPEAMHIVLTGNAHSRITPGDRRNRAYEPMGYLLVKEIGADRLTALNVAHAGGTSWICGPDCGVVRLRGHSEATRWSIEIDDATRPSGHHGWYRVGTIGASPPATAPTTVVESVSLPPEEAVEPAPAPTESFPPQTPEMLQPFQGSWQAYEYGASSWTLDIAGSEFRGEVGADDWYEGEIRLRPDSTPAEIDFYIRDCRCSYRGMSSKGIFRIDDESIVLATPSPGSARPTVFNENNGQMVRLKRIAEK